MTSTKASALSLTRLAGVMDLTEGRPEVGIGLLDGPVFVAHPMLVNENIVQPTGVAAGASKAGGLALEHGTLVAGMLTAHRGSPATAICPGCTVHVRPIFAEANEEDIADTPQASPEQTADAIVDCVGAGMAVVNISSALLSSHPNDDRRLVQALDCAMRAGVLVVVAAGNQSRVGDSVLTAHPWVISVAAFTLAGRPMQLSNFGSGIGTRGIGAPGERVPSILPDGSASEWSGTSASAPFVTGAIALLFSLFPAASALAVRSAIVPRGIRPRAIVPPLLDAWSSYELLRESYVAI